MIGRHDFAIVLHSFSKEYLILLVYSFSLKSIVFECNVLRLIGYHTFLLIAESAKRIPDIEEVSGQKGVELLRTPIELNNGYWNLKVVPWIGGRIISMTHLPSGNSFGLGQTS